MRLNLKRVKSFIFRGLWADPLVFFFFLGEFESILPQFEEVGRLGVQRRSLSLSLSREICDK